MKHFNQIKEGISNFWSLYSADIFHGGNIYITISLAILAFVFIILYFNLCFKLIKKASQKQNHILVLLGIILSGFIPGIIYYTLF